MSILDFIKGKEPRPETVNITPYRNKIINNPLNMNNRIICFLLALIPAVCAFADKEMTSRNIDAGESFEVSVPDGLKTSIQEYNNKWLDSIPYLMEHAKWKEPWAFEALAEYYRYGRGGIDKSLFNAIMCYEETGKSPRSIAEEAYEKDRTDEFGLINHIMEGLNKKRLSEKDAILLIDGLTIHKPNWIVFLREILCTKPDARKEFILSRLKPDSDSDEFLIGFTFLAMADSHMFDNIFGNVSEDYMRKIRFFGDKLTPIYDVIAEKMWRRYAENTEDKEFYLAVAMECMYHADRAGFLSKHNMNTLLTFCEKNGVDNRIPFSDEDLARFDVICRKGDRDQINSAVIVEEEAVEMDE